MTLPISQSAAATLLIEDPPRFEEGGLFGRRKPKKRSPQRTQRLLDPQLDRFPVILVEADFRATSVLVVLGSSHQAGATQLSDEKTRCGHTESDATGDFRDAEFALKGNREQHGCVASAQ